MRYPGLLALAFALAACGTQQQAADNVTTNVLEPAAASPDGLEAMAQVDRYFRLIAAKDFAAAHRMWDADSARQTSPDALAREYARFKQFDVTVGEPTEIKTQGGFDYIIVGARAEAERASGGGARTLDGRVHLKRANAQQGRAATAGVWQIWAVDIRKPKRPAA